jgi:hypothetical protein
MSAAQHSRRDRADHKTERNMNGRVRQPVSELLKWRQRIDACFAREGIDSRFWGLVG